MNRVADKYYVEPSAASNYKKADCAHNGVLEKRPVLSGYRGDVRRILLYCTCCGLIVDGM